MVGMAGGQGEAKARVRVWGLRDGLRAVRGYVFGGMSSRRAWPEDRERLRREYVFGSWRMACGQVEGTCLEG